MQPVVVDRPYQFIPPYPGRLWIRLFHLWVPNYLWRTWGIRAVEFRGVEHLQRSVDAGHGVLLAPNHPRPCDPFLLGALGLRVRRPAYCMASWHVFYEGGRLRGWLARRLGAFSVHRWGMDREALRAAIDILVAAERPLVLFPEGHITRTNDQLTTLLEGTAFIARSAARKRAVAEPPAQVVLHPVAIKYFFEGDLATSVEPVLGDIETRLTWQPQGHLPLLQRITRIGLSLLALKEIEYLGEPQTGPPGKRLKSLIDRLLQPLEQEWLGGRQEPAVVERAKRLRTAIVPDLVSGQITEQERQRRWWQLADIYLAQQLDCYPPDYIARNPTPERMLETIERFEEDLTDRARVHRPLKAVVQVGEALEVTPARERAGQEDPLMRQLQERLETLIVELGKERPAPSASLQAR
jgi:1-acyl-sn-glycerol-3-phosphate acyltransferase